MKFQWTMTMKNNKDKKTVSAGKSGGEKLSEKPAAKKKPAVKTGRRSEPGNRTGPVTACGAVGIVGDVQTYLAVTSR